MNHQGYNYSHWQQGFPIFISICIFPTNIKFRVKKSYLIFYEIWVTCRDTCSSLNLHTAKKIHRPKIQHPSSPYTCSPLASICLTWCLLVLKWFGNWQIIYNFDNFIIQHVKIANTCRVPASELWLFASFMVCIIVKWLSLRFGLLTKQAIWWRNLGCGNMQWAFFTLFPQFIDQTTLWLIEFVIK